jgi:hypothetical protein
VARAYILFAGAALMASSRLYQICPPSIDARYLRHNEESKNISIYNPYSIIMRKIKDVIDARHVSATRKGDHSQK